APASLTARIRNFEAVKEQQLVLLIRTALQLHRAGRPVTRDSLRQAEPSFWTADLAADRMAAAAHAVRPTEPALAAILDGLAGRPAPATAPATAGTQTASGLRP